MIENWQNMFSMLLIWFWIYSVIENWLKQTLYISYSYEENLVSFGNWPVIKAENKY